MIRRINHIKIIAFGQLLRPPLFDGIDSLIDHNPFKPGPKGCVCPVVMQITKGADKCLLEYILCLPCVVDDPVTYIVFDRGI